jgi:hypothetical protein
MGSKQEQHIPEPGPSAIPETDSERFAHLKGSWEKKGDAARDPGGFGRVVMIEGRWDRDPMVTLAISGAAVRTGTGFRDPTVTLSESELRADWQQIDFTPAEEIPIKTQRQWFREGIIRHAEDLKAGRVGDITVPGEE